MADRFDNTVAVVTGGGAHTDRALGIGEETAKLFAREGADVAVLDIEREMAERTIGTFEDGSGDTLALECDVTDDATVQAAMEAIDDAFGRIDVLVNNVGIRIPGSTLPDSNDEDMATIMDVNVQGIARVCRHAIPVMVRDGGGAIVNLASANATIGRRKWALYDATKAAVMALTRDAACDHAEDGIRVNAVSPGWTITDYHLGDIDDETAQRRVDEATTPSEDGPAILKRHAHPREQAETIAFLASDAASYITGSTIDVDAGINEVGHHL